MNNAEQAAKAYAIQKHGDQKYGDHPYVVHLAAVRQVIADFGITDPDLRVAAWLHDTIEDTKTTYEDIMGRFGLRVADFVWAVTGVGSTRKARNTDAYAKMRGYPPSIQLKLADRIANVEASYKTRLDLFAMYRKEHKDFYAQLHDLSGVKTWPHIQAMWTRLAQVIE